MADDLPDLVSEAAVESVMRNIPDCTRQEAIDRLKYDVEHRNRLKSAPLAMDHPSRGGGKVGPGPNCYGPMF